MAGFYMKCCRILERVEVNGITGTKYINLKRAFQLTCIAKSESNF